MTRVRAAGLAVLLVAAAAPAGAQRLELSVGRGPHYVGVPLEVRVVAEGFEEDPTPEIEAPTPASGQLDFVEVSPSVSTSVVVVNGRMTQTRDVRFVYLYRFVASEPGEIDVGSFHIRQGPRDERTPPLQLKIREVPRTDRVALELELPETPVHVGERVPVVLRFRLEEQLRDQLESYTLRVPLFEMTESFQFPDDPDNTRKTARTTPISIQTADGPLELHGQARRKGLGARTVFEVEVRRTLVPLREGPQPIPASSVVVKEGVRFRRDLFGRRRATRVRQLHATDRPRTLEVARLPVIGRPASFAGAVGKGFQLDVTADRTVVQVGEPITLTLTLRGDGNLETAALPPLDAPGLLAGARFRVPEGDLPGSLEKGAKRFEAVVRVIDESVREIPPLEYAWYDPDERGYQTTRSRPVALSVGPAQVVGAAQVLAGGAGSSARDASEERRKEGVSRELQLTGADLAIEPDPARLLRHPAAAWSHVWLPAGLYAGSVLVLALALVDRRRRDVDPALTARLERAERELAAIRGAAGAPAVEAAGVVAAALRRLLAEAPEGRSPELDAFLGECDARSYAPEGLRDATPLDPAFHERALELASALVERAS